MKYFYKLLFEYFTSLDWKTQFPVVKKWMPFVFVCVCMIINVFHQECLGISNDLYLLNRKLVTSTTGCSNKEEKMVQIFCRVKMSCEDKFILRFKKMSFTPLIRHIFFQTKNSLLYKDKPGFENILNFHFARITTHTETHTSEKFRVQRKL